MVSSHAFSADSQSPAERPDTQSLTVDLRNSLRQLDRGQEDYATRLVDRVLQTACQLGVSDIHWQPDSAGIQIRWRLDGVLHTLGTFPRGEQADPVARLKVMAQLLTYRNEVPQEGRVQLPESVAAAAGVEMRVSTFPTLYGERVAVRLFAARDSLLRLAQLGFPDDVTTALRQWMRETSGQLIITGPAGSGKTTTAYALLREIVAEHQGRRHVVSLEDPIEVPVTGVSQSQVHTAAGFDFTTGLRSLMRQDPEVILVGEMRDRETVEVAFQAALTGQLVLSTFHADSACGAINRLQDMGLQTYMLRSGLRGVLCQRLVRRLCDCAVAEDARELPRAGPADKSAVDLGLDVPRVWQPQGCAACQQTGYQGRVPIVEYLPVDLPELAAALQSASDVRQLEGVVSAAGLRNRWDQARLLVAQGLTSPSEVRRVLGFGEQQQ